MGLDENIASFGIHCVVENPGSIGEGHTLGRPVTGKRALMRLKSVSRTLR